MTSTPGTRALIRSAVLTLVVSAAMHVTEPTVMVLAFGAGVVTSLVMEGLFAILEGEIILPY